MNTRATFLTSTFVAATVFGAGLVASAEDTAVDTERPGAPRNVWVLTQSGTPTPVVSFARSTDDTGIDRYEIYVDGDIVAEVDDADATPDDAEFEFSRRVELPPLDDGDRWIQLVGVDTVGNRSVRSAPVRHVVDTRGPSAPDIVGHTVFTDGAGFTGVSLEFTLVDRGDVESCSLTRNLQRTFFGFFVPPIDATSGTTVDGAYAEDILAGGIWWYQITCSDAFGNSSVRSAPERVDLSDLTPVE